MYKYYLVTRNKISYLVRDELGILEQTAYFIDSGHNKTNEYIKAFSNNLEQFNNKSETYREIPLKWVKLNYPELV